MESNQSLEDFLMESQHDENILNRTIKEEIIDDDNVSLSLFSENEVKVECNNQILNRPIKEEIIDDFLDDSNKTMKIDKENFKMQFCDNHGSDEEGRKVCPMPIKKNKKGKIVGEQQRISIIKEYETNKQLHPDMSLRVMRKLIGDSMGIGDRTIYKVIKEYNDTKTLTIPKNYRIKRTIFDNFDEANRNAVRKHVHSIWFNHKIPTVDKIYELVSTDDSLPSISRTNLYRLLKTLGFRYTKRSRNSALIEKHNLVLWRRQYLRSIQQYRKEGRHIYYIDETWVDINDSLSKMRIDIRSCANPLRKGKQLIALNIGSEDGFVCNGLLCFESKKNTTNFHSEINEDLFHKWFESILPQLKPNSVVVMDNASYHSKKIDRAPSSTTSKVDIIKWLTDKGEIINKPMVIPQLLEIVKRLKPKYERYAIDELAKANNQTILRIPPYHCELNTMELAWSSVKNYVKMNNTTFKLPEVEQLLRESVKHVDAEMWSKFIKQTKKEEEKLFEIDFIIDETLETTNFRPTVTEDTSSDLDSDYS